MDLDARHVAMVANWTGQAGLPLTGALRCGLSLRRDMERNRAGALALRNNHAEMIWPVEGPDEAATVSSGLFKDIGAGPDRPLAYGLMKSAVKAGPGGSGVVPGSTTGLMTGGRLTGNKR